MSEQTNELQQMEMPEARGSVTYANDVVATIAGLAATACEGVAGMSGGIAGGIAELLGRKNLTRGVKVEVGETETAIDLYIIVNYGSCLPDVCRGVQAAVRHAIESMTDLRVVEVNIFVQGVEFEKDTADDVRVR